MLGPVNVAPESVAFNEPSPDVDKPPVLGLVGHELLPVVAEFGGGEAESFDFPIVCD